MENTERIQKINWFYLFLNTLGPAVFMVGMIALGVALPQQFGLLCAFIGFGGAVLWWSFLGHRQYEKKRDRRINALTEQGFTCNHIFNSEGNSLIVDLAHGQVALIFRWNPGKTYIRPASTLSDVHVEDGRSGGGPLAGSSRVSFLFRVDGIKIRVNTFTSNRRWRMDSDYILTGVSKADMMVEALRSAGAKGR